MIIGAALFTRIETTHHPRYPIMRTITCLLALLVVCAVATAQPATQPTTQPSGGFFGARLATVNDQVADQIGLNVDWGVLVGELLPDSPAAKAGIEEHDVIQQVEGQTVKALPDFQKVMRTTKPGQEITVTVLRGEATKEFKVTLGTRPPNTQGAGATTRRSG
jgi:S1-C subfamily serine protease